MPPANPMNSRRFMSAPLRKRHRNRSNRNLDRDKRLLCHRDTDARPTIMNAWNRRAIGARGASADVAKRLRLDGVGDKASQLGNQSLEAPAQRSKSLLRRNGNNSGRFARRSWVGRRILAMNCRSCSVRPATHRWLLQYGRR